MSDYISRQAVIDYLMINMTWYDEDGRTIDDWSEKQPIITDLINGVPSAAADINVLGKWVSVKDRLPENQSPVLVYVPPYQDEEDDYIGYVGMAYYTWSVRGGYWAGTDGAKYGAIGFIHTPTHWMPLPEPPK